MITTDEKIRAAIKVECDRLGLGEDARDGLWFAYISLSNQRDSILTKDMLTLLADHIEPGYRGQYRTTPAHPNSVNRGIHPLSIERSTFYWIDWFNHKCDLCGSQDSKVEQVIKEFLDIRPFNVENERVAWLLRVWLLDQWDDPQPLPEYYR